MNDVLTTTSIPDTIPVTVDVPVWKLLSKDGYLAQRYRGVCETMYGQQVRAGLLLAVKQLMTDHAGKRYQCSKRWAQQATAVLNEYIGSLTAADDSVDPRRYAQDLTVSIRREDYPAKPGHDIMLVCYWWASPGGGFDGGKGCEKVYIPSFVEIMDDGEHECAGEYVQGWPTRCGDTASIADCLGWAIVASVNFDTDCPGLEAPRFPGPMGWEANPHPGLPNGEPLHQQDVAVRAVDSGEWRTPLARAKHEVRRAADDAMNPELMVQRAAEYLINREHCLDAHELSTVPSINTAVREIYRAMVKNVTLDR